MSDSLNLDIKDLKGEKWKPVVGYEDLYEVSNKGRVKSLKRNKILRPHISKVDNFMRVCLCKTGTKMRNCSISRLVALAFIKNPNNYKYVFHKSSDILDNTLSNLYWDKSCGWHNKEHHESNTGMKCIHFNTLTRMYDVKISVKGAKFRDSFPSIAHAIRSYNYIVKHGELNRTIHN